MKITRNDGHNDPVIHVFRDEVQCREWFSENAVLTEDMIDELLEDGEVDDDGFVTWAIFDGYYTIDHTKEP